MNLSKEYLGKCVLKKDIQKGVLKKNIEKTMHILNENPFNKRLICK